MRHLEFFGSVYEIKTYQRLCVVLIGQYECLYSLPSLPMISQPMASSGNDINVWLMLACRLMDAVRYIRTIATSRIFLPFSLFLFLFFSLKRYLTRRMTPCRVRKDTRTLAISLPWPRQEATMTVTEAKAGQRFWPVPGVDRRLSDSHLFPPSSNVISFYLLISLSLSLVDWIRLKRRNRRGRWPSPLSTATRRCKSCPVVHHCYPVYIATIHL